MKNKFVTTCRMAIFCLLMLVLLFGNAWAQGQPIDSSIHDLALYAKGKRKITAGAITLSAGAVMCLAAAMMSEETEPVNTTGTWGLSGNIGPKNNEMLLALGVLTAGVGAAILISGISKVNKSRNVDLGFQPYWKAPGVQAQMPVLSFRLPLGTGRRLERRSLARRPLWRRPIPGRRRSGSRATMSISPIQTE